MNGNAWAVSLIAPRLVLASARGHQTDACDDGSHGQGRSALGERAHTLSGRARHIVHLETPKLLPHEDARAMELYGAGWKAAGPSPTLRVGGEGR